MPRDWLAWHGSYEAEGSPLARRLAVVQGHIRRFLDVQPPGAVRVVSMCAGQGRDLIGVLEGHPRRGDVTARLVELDADNAARAQASAADAHLDGVTVVEGDAGSTDAYGGAVPADLVLACGVFGNVTDDDIRTTIDALASLCAPGATVVWTRGPRTPDHLTAVDGWFRAAGFALDALDDGGDGAFGVGVHHLVVEPRPYRPAVRLFRFVDRAEPV